MEISIHALLAESDLLCLSFFGKVLFLSTLSLRRATRVLEVTRNAHTDFYPRSPCGERPQTARNTSIAGHFYPRSPCGERPQNRHLTKHPQKFLSTLSLRRATRGWTLNINGPIFLSTLSLRRATITITITCIALKFLSTLSLRRATKCSFGNPYKKPYFYPRSPCGERRQTKQTCRVVISISIHALLAESDNSANKNLTQVHHFYPRSPCGERHL